MRCRGSDQGGEGTFTDLPTTTTAVPAASVAAADPADPSVRPDERRGGDRPTVLESHRPPGPPTPDNPAILYIAGDSDAGSIGPSLQRLATKTGVVKSVLDYKVSSGLTRPDFFDWPKHLQKKVPEVGPQIVVVPSEATTRRTSRSTARATRSGLRSGRPSTASGSGR
jgi:hypothetical protein